MRRLLAVLAMVSAAAAVVGGCSFSPSAPSPSSSPSSPVPASSSPSSSKKASAPLPDAATILQESSATTENLASAHLALWVSGNIEEMPVTALDGDLTNRPGAAAAGNARLTLTGSEVDVEFVVFGGDLYAAQSGDNWIDYGPAAEIYDVAAILNPETGLANMLTGFIDPEVEARETVDGEQTVRVSGEVTADAVNGLVPQLGVTKRVPCTVWIQEKGDHQLVQLKLVPSSGNVIEMALSNWNEPVVVRKPPV